MGTRTEQRTYFDAFSRSNWTTWLCALMVALALNLTLFSSMPRLLSRTPVKPQYDQFTPPVFVVRVPRPEPPPREKPVKRPEPPPEKKQKPSANPEPRKAPKTRLSLPFEINPSLPSAPGALELPPMERASFETLDTQELFSVGNLDGPLIVLARVPPVYPFSAKRRGVEGWVKVRFVVNEQGSVEDVSIMEAKPPGVFDQNVIRCVLGWRFKPGTVGGVEVKTLVETTVRFKLEQ